VVGQKSRFMYRSDKCLVLCIGRTYVVVGQMSGRTNVGLDKCWNGKMLGRKNVGRTFTVGQKSYHL
jgi:hypothetical protein